MRRKIIKIDEDKCDGCGACVPSCAEGAIQIIDGKARLVSETYCDGLGACLNECPQGALTIEECEADAFDPAAVKRHLSGDKPAAEPKLPCGCPGAMSRQIKRRPATQTRAPAGEAQSELTHWPVQLTFVPPDAPYLKGADLLLVADCVPFALADFHARLLRGRPVVIGCPKLDDPAFYADKLTEIVKASEIASITVVHMEVPCCTGLVRIAQAALDKAGSEIELQDVTVSISGEVMDV